ncbi:MAG: F0F1 ATP synthase subunit gamma [Eubacteriales bacterium]|nr:F0F1 ATP synthase subunit gamma [Eubacteriales bacterium]
MSESASDLQRKIGHVHELHELVRAMKALALSSISLFEQAIISLESYAQVVETSLGACFRDIGPISPVLEQRIKSRHQGTAVIVFGSDHGLVGSFNHDIAQFAREEIKSMAKPLQVIAVGERASSQLIECGISPGQTLKTPHSVPLITPLVSQVLAELDASGMTTCYLLYHEPGFATDYQPVIDQVLPFDDRLSGRWTSIPWPGQALPEVLEGGAVAVRSLIREFLFITIYRACALSITSENSSRLSAMQRADQNIEALLDELKSDYNQQRQRLIDDDLFDVLSGYEALRKPWKNQN